jgi:transcriptional regulator with XRE-family HTH domain
MAFGAYISEARKKAGLSQKELASRINKEDGEAISPQYLNDIEHDRRNPPGEFILSQLAKELDLSLDYLRYLSGRLAPDDIRNIEEPEKVEEAFKAFRRIIKGK